jgi:CHAD domain-containing protein
MSTIALPAANEALLMRFQADDSGSKVSRDTVKRLAKQLGLKREAEVLHYAVKKLAAEVLPHYELDDGALTAKQIAAIQKAAGQAGQGRVTSSLFAE